MSFLSVQWMRWFVFWLLLLAKDVEWWDDTCFVGPCGYTPALLCV